ncbi:hypothetical protein FIBSPDRAFT_933798 [Athelia psychrophila]|uniref:Uncharacterized protein n=1 Tax=Athelia psychrophila TaxID=1759441 RepID=A0A166GIM3_9AGAM|nr:hypothetical protein FIBSPDRAFT_933798 [Fibularhizoctonia sp. CBS 109695]
MTSAHIAPHVENLSNTFGQFLGHIESGHEAPHGKSFPEPEHHHFYIDLHKEVQASHKICHEFHEMKPALLARGVKGSDIVLAFEGETIAIIAMFDSLKAADPPAKSSCLLASLHRNTHSETSQDLGESFCLVIRQMIQYLRDDSKANKDQRSR